MQIGILTNWDKEQFEKRLKKGEAVGVGVSPESLLEDIRLALYRTRYDGAAALQIIEHDLLVLTGRVQEPKEKEGDD